jgi:putative tryptophan/tyrosine transport system substrate-binding protein
MRRREFIAGLGSVAAGPIVAHAQQSAIPVIGFLHLFPQAAAVAGLTAFRMGLNEAGFAEGRNIAIEQRYADNDPGQLPALAADLVRRGVAAVYASSPPAARAAKAATSTIPIVFVMGEDPVTEGIVTSLNRPGGNITGFTDFDNLLIGKRFELMHKIVPNTLPFAFLVNPVNANAEPDTKAAQAAADALGRRLTLLRASSERELDAAFEASTQQKIGALLVGVDGFFLSRLAQITVLAAHYRIPALYDNRLYPLAGGLMSYGANRSEMSRQAGIYIARILRGEKPATLPVQQSAKFEFVINLRVAKTLDLEIPPAVLALADEVIE